MWIASGPRKKEMGVIGKGWVDRDPPVVKINVLSTRRMLELLRLLRSRRSSGAKFLPPSAGAQLLL